MTFLLDTNVISELRRPERATRDVVEWIAAQSADILFSAVSVLELQIGAIRMERRDKFQGEMLQSWIDEFVLPRFEDRIVAIDAKIALRCAALHVPDPRPDRDAYIAATALVRDFTVVTRNTRDFEPTGVKLFNPWLD